MCLCSVCEAFNFVVIQFITVVCARACYFSPASLYVYCKYSIKKTLAELHGYNISVLDFFWGGRGWGVGERTVEENGK